MSTIHYTEINENSASYQVSISSEYDSDCHHFNIATVSITHHDDNDRTEFIVYTQTGPRGTWEFAGKHRRIYGPKISDEMQNRLHRAYAAWRRG